jgi:hypothetical protein
VNRNCLEGFKCPMCGHEDAFIIETSGVIEGQKKPSQFKARYTDDGFDNPLTVGDTCFVDGGMTICDECGYTNLTDKFQGKNIVKDSYPNNECPDCGKAIPDDVANGESCDNCGHVFCLETEDDDAED